jgi:tetratricopeptide (TPR) repeat protein
LAQHFYYSGQYDRALDLINRRLETRPDDPALHVWRGQVYEHQGRTGEAIEEFQKAISLSEGINGLGSLGHAYAASGKLGDAENTLRKLDELSKQKYVSPFQKALIYAGLGQNDRALSELEKAYNERSLLPVALRWDPRLNGLRSEPRFRDFMRRVGLPG